MQIGGWGLVAGNWWLEAQVARAWLAGGLGLGWWQWLVIGGSVG